MAGTEKHVIQTATFAPVSCRRLATDFRNHLLDYMPHPRKLRLPRMGILFGRTMNDMNRIDKLVKIISRSTLLGREIDVEQPKNLCLRQRMWQNGLSTLTQG